MKEGVTLILIGANGRRSSRFVVTRLTVIGLCLLCLLGAVAGLWVGWKIGEMTSERAIYHTEARV